MSNEPNTPSANHGETAIDTMEGTSVRLTEEECFPVIEACLFAAGHPVKYEKLGEVFGLTEDECKDVVEKMKPLYNSNTPFPRGILLVTFPDTCQLCTKEAYGPLVKQALGIRRGGNLSQSLLEVLSIVAYNQPATRAFIETVRGVDSGYAISALTEKNLIECCGRLDAPGRPSLYRTTEDFLRIFGLSAINDLPAIQVRNSGGETIEIAPITLEGEEPVGAMS